MADHIHTLTREQAERFLTEGRKDPLTLQAFSTGERVVVCRHCGIVSLHATWQSLGDICLHCKGKETQPELPAAQSEGIVLGKRGGGQTISTPGRPWWKRWRLAAAAALVTVIAVWWRSNAPQPLPPVEPPPPSRGLIFEVTMFQEEWKRVHQALHQLGLPIPDPNATEPSDSTRRAIAKFQSRIHERPTGYQTYSQTLRLISNFMPHERPKGVSICNRTSTRAWIAIGYHSNGGLLTAGWHPVDVDKCRDVSGIPVNDFIYLSAVNDHDRTLEYGDEWLCGTETRSFAHSNARACSANREELLRYQKVSFGTSGGVRVSVFQID